VALVQQFLAPTSLAGCILLTQQPPAHANVLPAARQKQAAAQSLERAGKRWEY